MTTEQFATRRTNIVAGVVFLAVVPLVSHICFSWMGFTPTDEGFTLALSRRMLDGQLPHRDFIVIRPFFSPLIHLPFVLFGGQYTFWLSRLFVWFEFAVVAWLWVSIINRSLSFPFSPAARILVALIAFAATVHTKHLTAWFTIDGLFLATMGLALVVKRSRTAKLSGYFLLGLALLCKQSFLFMAPVALLIVGDWRRLNYWLSALTPGFVYGVYLIATGSLSDAFVQLTAPTDLASIALQRYRDSWLLVSAVLGYLAGWLLLDSQRLAAKSRARLAWLVLFAGPLVLAAVGLSRGTWAASSFWVFGWLIGATVHLAINRSGLDDELIIMGLVLLTAFSVSLSGGYTSPALASGPIIAVLIAMVFKRFQLALGRGLTYSLIAAALIVTAAFAIGRARYIYRDRPAMGLNQPLGQALRGGTMIYTNPNTYAFMSDLNRAIELARGQRKEFAILPDVAAYWVTAPQQNYLPAVWPIAGELSTPRLMNRFIQAMESRRNRIVLIVQKVDTVSLANGFVPLADSDYYEVARYARGHFAKIGETEFFELYE